MTLNLYLGGKEIKKFVEKIQKMQLKITDLLITLHVQCAFHMYSTSVAIKPI